MYIETEIVHTVAYDDFDKYVASIYGVEDYSIVEDSESCNDSALSSGAITKEKEPDLYKLNQINEFRTTKKFSYMWRTILQDLVNNDKIPEGKYIITISW